MTPDRIERAVTIAAPIERVWQLITRPEHIGSWFGDAGAELDLRPGGALTVRWDGGHVVHGVVEAVEPPTRFAYRWLLTDTPQPATPGNSTLVELTLRDTPEGTVLQAVESGFAGLDLDAGARLTRHESHVEGWPRELDDLARYAGKVRA